MTMRTALSVEAISFQLLGHPGYRAAGSTNSVGTPSVLFLTVNTRVPGLRPGRISLTSKFEDLRRVLAASMFWTRQERPQSLSGLSDGSSLRLCTTSTMRSPARKNINRAPHFRLRAVETHVEAEPGAVERGGAVRMRRADDDVVEAGDRAFACFGRALGVRRCLCALGQRDRHAERRRDVEVDVAAFAERSRRIGFGEGDGRARLQRAALAGAEGGVGVFDFKREPGEAFATILGQCEFERHVVEADRGVLLANDHRAREQALQLPRRCRNVRREKLDAVKRGDQVSSPIWISVGCSPKST